MELKEISDGNSDLSLVELKWSGKQIGYHPHCKKHGAMLRVSKDIKMYRCIRAEPDKSRYNAEQRKAMDCRAGCIVE